MNVRRPCRTTGVALELASLALGVAALPSLVASSTSEAPLQGMVVSEIVWMGTTVSYNSEWIELYNSTASLVDLIGWSFSAADGTPSTSLSGTFPPGGYFLLERTNDDSVPSVTRDLLYSSALENDGEDLILHDGASNVINRVISSGRKFAGRNETRVPMVRVDTTAVGNLATNSACISCNGQHQLHRYRLDAECQQ